jgi:hypothetical protein
MANPLLVENIVRISNDVLAKTRIVVKTALVSASNKKIASFTVAEHNIPVTISFAPLKITNSLCPGPIRT